MKQKINVDKYIGENGRYIIENDDTFKQDFGVLHLKHINLMKRINRINNLCLKHAEK